MYNETRKRTILILFKILLDGYLVIFIVLISIHIISFHFPLKFSDDLKTFSAGSSVSLGVSDNKS